MSGVSGEFTREEARNIQSNLAKKLGPEFVSSRSNGAGNVAYLEGAKAINLANEIFGFNGWSFSVGEFCTDYCDVSDSRRVNLGLSVVVRVTLKDGSYREDIGYGTVENARTKGAAYEKCRKEAITDGLKRALRLFGNALGNCLYDKDFIRKVGRIKARDIPVQEGELFRDANHRPVQAEGPSAAASAQVNRNSNPPMTTTTATGAGKSSYAPSNSASTNSNQNRSNSATTATNNTTNTVPTTAIKTIKPELLPADLFGSDELDDDDFDYDKLLLPDPPKNEGSESVTPAPQTATAGVATSEPTTGIAEPVAAPIQFVHGSQAEALQSGKSSTPKFDVSYQTPDIKRTIEDRSMPVRRPVTPARSPLVGLPKVRQRPLSDQGPSAVNLPRDPKRVKVDSTTTTKQPEVTH
uniref:DNA repair and recombination protein RAD52 n=1 Tax=Blastobotrys adeninivorans TaxID=409370 RepID=A0A060TCG3_BLAAD